MVAAHSVFLNQDSAAQINLVHALLFVVMASLPETSSATIATLVIMMGAQQYVPLKLDLPAPLNPVIAILSVAMDSSEMAKLVTT